MAAPENKIGSILKSDGTSIRDLLSEGIKIEGDISSKIELENLVKIAEKFNVHGFNIVEQIKDGFGNSMGFLEEMVKHDKKETKLRTQDSIIRDETAQELKKIHSDHYKKIEDIEKKQDKNKKEKKENLKDLAGSDDVSVAREAITGNAFTKAIKLKMFDINKGFSESLKGIPFGGKALSKFFSPESKNQQNIDELKDVEKTLEDKRKALGSAGKGTKEEQSIKDQIIELENQRTNLTDKIGSGTEDLVKTEKENSSLEFEKLSQETVLQTQLLEKIDATLNRTDISNELRLDLEELRIDQNDKLIEAQEGMKKIFEDGQQTEQQERQSEKQEEEIAKKEERTWMEKLFSSLSGGESEVKPENGGGGFWGFLALTGIAIGALVATALAPFVTWLKSRLDIIKALMPDEMLNKIDDFFKSVKTKFIEIKASAIQKIDDIKQWFSKLKEDVLKKFEPVIQKFDELKANLLKKFEPVTKFFKSLGGLFGKADEASPSLFKKLTSFLGFFDGIFGFFRGFLKGFTVVFRFLSRVLGRIPFIGQIIDFAVGIFKGFQEGLSGMDLLFSGITGIFAGGIGGTADLLVDSLNWILGLFGFNLKESLGLGEDFSFEKLIRDSFFKVYNFFKTMDFKKLLTEDLPKTIDGIGTTIKDVVSKAIKSIGDFFGLELNLESIKKWVDPLMNTLWGMITNPLETLLDSVGGLFNIDFKGFIKSMVQKLPDTAIAVISAIPGYGWVGEPDEKPEEDSGRFVSEQEKRDKELSNTKNKNLKKTKQLSFLETDLKKNDITHDYSEKDRIEYGTFLIESSSVDDVDKYILYKKYNIPVSEELQKQFSMNENSVMKSFVPSTNQASDALDSVQSQQNRLNSEKSKPTKTTDQSMVNSGNVVSNTTHITTGTSRQDSPSFN